MVLAKVVQNITMAVAKPGLASAAQFVVDILIVALTVVGLATAKLSTELLI